MEVSVGFGGEGCEAAVEVLLVSAAVVDEEDEVVAAVPDEVDVLLVEIEDDELVDEEDNEEDDVEGAVAVGTVEFDTRVRLSLTQNGASVSAPVQVCPSAQHMDPHWKSPTVQTRVQPTPPAPAGQQRKPPLSSEHVSPAPPLSEWLAFASSV